MDSPVHEEVLEDLAVTIARETAALALTVRERAVADPGGLDTKSSATDVVTEGDRACEALVRERLAAARPDDLVLGEEGGTSGTPAPGQVRWIVDPIDGTVNYTHGLPWFSVSIGAEVDGVVVAGAVVEPVSGRVWRAARGHGAFRDDAPLRASALEDLRLGVVGTGLNYDPARRGRQAAVLARIATSIGDVRRTGCASLDLCAVAAGWLDGFYEHGLQPWDVAAGSLIAEEAGAVVRLPGPGDGRSGGRGDPRRPARDRGRARGPARRRGGRRDLGAAVDRAQGGQRGVVGRRGRGARAVGGRLAAQRPQGLGDGLAGGDVAEVVAQRQVDLAAGAAVGHELGARHHEAQRARRGGALGPVADLPDAGEVLRRVEGVVVGRGRLGDAELAELGGRQLGLPALAGAVEDLSRARRRARRPAGRPARRTPAVRPPPPPARRCRTSPSPPWSW